MHGPYLQYKTYMKERFGEALFRVPIDFQLGCPNREADGSGGCTFCNMRGAKAVQTLQSESVEDQMQQAIRFARERYGAKRFMAYIQAFSATFGPKQRPKYRALLNAFDFSAVSIGTRPDCLTPQAYAFLSELNEELETWVELGVQTVHDRTLERINRGHNWASSEKTIRKLHEHGIKVAVHVILGLPGETAEDYRQTAETLAALPIDAIKVHNLHIEKGTTLAREHEKTPVPTLMEHDYAEHLMDFIRRLPSDIPIMRLTTDTLDDELIAPRWHMAKGQFVDYVVQQMTCREWRQGDLHNSSVTIQPSNNPSPQTPSPLRSVTTEDGSLTFWNEEYKEHYHTPAGARLEAEEKYIVPGKLKERLEQGDVALLDVCFGLGYNSLTATEAFRPEAVDYRLNITALEMDRRVVGAAARHIETTSDDTFDWRACLTSLYETKAYTPKPKASLQMLWGDARYTLTKLEPETYDLVFLDAFSTQRNSELWTVDFFRKLKQVMKPDAVLLTYCAALPVRSAFLEAGFYVGETEPVGRQRSGTIVALQQKYIDRPLPAKELEVIQQTTRGLPYRDPHGVWTNKEILRDRQERILKQKRKHS